MSDQDQLADDYKRHNLGGNNQGQNQNQQGQPGGYNFQPGSSFQPGASSFQPGAQSFTPGQYFNNYNQYGQYGQYNNQYGQYGGQYNQYGQYGGGGYRPQQPQRQQQQDDSTMTLEEFQAKKSFNPAPPGGAKKAEIRIGGSNAASSATKPKTEIRIGGGSSSASPKPKTEIRLGGSKKEDSPKTEIRIGGAKKEESPAPAAPKKEESPAPTPAQAQEPAAVEEQAPPSTSSSPAPTPTPKEETPKPAASTQKKTESAATSRSATATPQQPEQLDAEAQEKLDKEIAKDLFGGEDVKAHMSIIFMGHVDAGKSTLSGQLLYLTGAVSERIVQKFKQEAIDAGRAGWYLSWLMDLNSEERAEGKTIEIGRSAINTEKKQISILDAPGHKMYVPAMIGGASQADVGILVISARKGEFETGFEKGGQTREHAVLAKQSGVNKLIVAVNKMDDPTVEWSKERYDECITKLSKFLKTIGYNIKNDVITMPVSGLTGAGLKDRIDDSVCNWYDGPALLEYLDSVEVSDRKLGAPFMMPVANKGKDLGTFVDGKIEAGHVTKGNKFLLMPNKIPVEISAVLNETEEEIKNGIVGEQVRLRLKGVEEEDVSIGFVLTSSKNPVRTTSKVLAHVAFVELPNIVTSGYTCVMHIHTAVVEVTITNLLHKLQKGTGKKSKTAPAFAKRGMQVVCQIESATPFSAELFSELPRLGRFTLRDSGVTIAIGKITKIADNS